MLWPNVVADCFSGGAGGFIYASRNFIKAVGI